MAIACFFGDEKEKTDNRKKFTVIKINSIDLIVSGGERIISTITSSKKKDVEELKDVVEDVIHEADANQEFNIDLYARYY
jgi:hypothetical protein